MRRILLALTALAVAAPAAAAAPKPGDRTVSPEALLAELGAGVSDAELARVAAEAERHPLGTAANPVRVGGPDGARAYVARLRCADGSTPKVGASSAAGVGAYGTVVAAWPLDCGAAAPGAFPLVIDMYHEEHRETRAPEGFTLASH